MQCENLSRYTNWFNTESRKHFPSQTYQSQYLTLCCLAMKNNKKYIYMILMHGEDMDIKVRNA